jgi:arylamine N-acetyltransferase
MYNLVVREPELSVQAYLDRINYRGSTDTSLKTLSALQEAHLSSVPYENLDILAGKHNSLAPASLYDRIVVKHRGGYCFELNGLFAWLLEKLGFQLVEYFGRWLKYEPIEIPMCRHRIPRVEIEGKSYIADVGLGHFGSRRPLLFEEGVEQDQDDEKYRIVRHEKMGWIVQDFYKGGWVNIFSFSEDPRQPIDFFQPHWYCTTHPDSIFKNTTMVYIRTQEGRNTIFDVTDMITGEKVPQFRIYKGDTLETFIPRSEKEYKDALKQYFGIDIEK